MLRKIYKRSPTTYAWWLKMHKRSQLRLISFLELLEFIFPRRDELKLYYRLHSEKAVFSVYLIHVAKSLFRSALGFPPVALLYAHQA